MTDQEPMDYSKTLFLPQTDFLMRAGLPEREPEFLQRWEEMRLYERLRAQSAGRDRFVLHDGPPYANGHLHISHALNKILKDIIIRSRQMMGFDSNYVPGWDCHGLPIEWKIEEEYRAKGQNKDDVPVIEFRRQCREFAAKWVDIQREEFKRLGGTGDWENPYLTMSFDAEAQIAREIMKFAENGTLYRGSKPVMWSVVEKTALAEAEVEYHDHTSDAITVAFPVKFADDELKPKVFERDYLKQEYITPAAAARVATLAADMIRLYPEYRDSLSDASVVIWTTTPWTMPGNRAISFSKRISYGLYEVTAAPENNWARVGAKYILADKLAEGVMKSAKVEAFERRADIPAEVLAGLVCAHPLASLGYDFPVPLLEGDHVTDDAGTGFVHTAPGHGADDYIIWTKYQRELRTRGIDTTIPYTVDADGSLTNEAPGFTGRFVLTHKGEKGDANDAVIKALSDAGNILARSRLKHQYPHSWRSKKPVIFRNTPQWFISMDKDIASISDTLRARALNAIKATQWVPAYGENRINGMIESRPDWVVSRQRAWGVPITIFVHKTSGEILRDPAVNARIAEAFALEGADAWFADGAAQRFLGAAYSAEDYEKIDDVLDVWFDSGSTHSYTLETRPDLKVHRKVDGGKDTVMYLEGSDQHRGWFHSSLLESCGTRGRAPFDVVLTHGFVMDQNGAKMSKSLGNVVTPQEVIKQSGADILRLWVASSDYSDDLRLGKAILQTNIDAYRKLRNTLRWMLGSLAHFDRKDQVPLADMPELERYILAELSKLGAEIEKSYETYDFKRICSALTQFMNVDLSAFYFDIRKDTLYCEPASSKTRKAALTVVDILFNTLTRWLAPLLVFTADEAWMERYGADKSVHLEPFAELDKQWCNEELLDKWSIIRDVRRVVTGALELERAQKRIGSSLEAAPIVYMTDSATRALFDGQDLAEICITSAALLTNGEGPADAFRLPDVAGVAVVSSRARGIKCARSWKYFDPATADPAYPDITPRDALAMRDYQAAQAEK